MLDDQERRLLALLIEAAKWVDRIYLKQCNCSNGFDPDQPNNFFPRNATKESIEAYLAKHPESRDDILSPFSVVVETPIGGLTAIPYSEFYKEEMSTIADILYQAAYFAKDKQFHDFLIARSESFRTNKYRESDIAWIHTSNGPIEFSIGPFENYADTLFGVKRTFQCFIGLVLTDETREAGRFQEFVAKFDAMLGERYGYVSKPKLTPMVVMHLIYLSGECAHVGLAMACNLPNDADIQKEVGSKKFFMLDVMEAKCKNMTIPIAKRVLPSEETTRFNSETYLRFIVGHESSHGLSFRFNGQHFGHLSNGIEECKADIFGIWFLYFLMMQDFFKHTVAENAVMIHLTDCLRQIRSGPEKAHAIGALIQFNWFIKHEAMNLRAEGIRFNTEHFMNAITSLCDTLYTLAESKDVMAAEKFVMQWGKTIPEHLRSYLDRFSDLPVDIDPFFAF